jgi:pyrroline-5-carboxylate reductase
MRPRLLVVGGGRMGSALVRGLLAAGWPSDALGVVEASEARRAELAQDLTGVRVAADPEPADGAVLAVKPKDGREACRALARTGASRVLSIMAGVRLADLEEWLGPGVAVLRAMPNTPALVRAGIAALAGASGCGEEDLAWGEEVLGAVGRVVRVTEADLDAVTGLSGSGPAYVFLVAEALTDAGVAAGLPADVSAVLAVETLAGSGRLLVETGEPPAVLRAQVTSPGGTTEAGIAALESGGIRAALTSAVMAAAARSAELADPA